MSDLSARRQINTIQVEQLTLLPDLGLHPRIDDAGGYAEERYLIFLCRKASTQMVHGCFRAGIRYPRGIWL